MSIICRNCKYTLEYSDLAGRVVGDVYEITLSILPTIIQAIVTDSICSRNLKHSFANRIKLECPNCSKIAGWSVEENLQPSTPQKPVEKQP